MNVLLVGGIKGVNRSQQLICFLKNKVNKGELRLRKTPKIFHKRVMRNIYWLEMIYNLFNLLWADVVIYMAMNERNTIILCIAKWLGRKVIVDYYSPRYFIAVTDRKINEYNLLGSRRKSWLKKIDKRRISCATDLLVLTALEVEIIFMQASVVRTDQVVHVVPLVIPKYAYRKTSVRYPLQRTTFNVCWWGKSSNLHGFNYIKDEFNTLLANDSEVILYLFDDDIDRANELGGIFSNIIKKFPGKVKISSDVNMSNGLADWLVNNCDVALGPLGFTETGLSTIPNKLVESWLLGLPMITQKSNAIDEFSMRACVVIESEQAGLLESKILDIKSKYNNDDPSVDDMIKLGKKIYSDNYSIESYVNNMSSII